MRRGGLGATILAATIILSAGAWFIAIAVISYRTGEAFSKTGIVYRRESPIWFWIHVMVFASIGVGLLFYTAWLLVTRLLT